MAIKYFLYTIIKNLSLHFLLSLPFRRNRYYSFCSTIILLRAELLQLSPRWLLCCESTTTPLHPHLHQNIYFYTHNSLTRTYYSYYVYLFIYRRKNNNKLFFMKVQGNFSHFLIISLFHFILFRRIRIPPFQFQLHSNYCSKNPKHCWWW